MARPRLGDEERRTRTIGVRVTEAEAAELAERAHAARLSMGAYMRHRALGQPVADRARAPAGCGGSPGAQPDRGESESDGAGAELRSGAGAGRDAGGGGAGRRARGGTPGRGGGLMVVKMAGLGRSFAGVAAYCLHDRREPGKAQPESAERVEWTDTRNLPTSRGDRAAAVMAATAEGGSGAQTPGGGIGHAAGSWRSRCATTR